MPAGSIHLIVTSPPYADARSNTYGGVSVDHYVHWFTEISRELFRVLRDDGSFVLNIKERVIDGERAMYVIDLIQALRGQGWRWTEEYLWHKKNCHPGKWPNRFRDAWERCLHFTKAKKFSMYQDAVKVPMGDWRHARLKNLSATDRTRDDSKVSSGFGKNVSNWIGRELAYPTNVLHMATECGNQKHSAAFPIALPTFFVKLFTKEGDVVLDPFVGSGTTAMACRELNRRCIGIEIKEEYAEIARRRVSLGTADAPIE
ncbi:MAG TPA: site-specific DNA-methyltransferase [Tepidisphaeraceae bacterium]|nr:site-specific DNA-methyltransferase [Tepidisphaeraceae bacterium]